MEELKSDKELIKFKVYISIQIQRINNKALEQVIRDALFNLSGSYWNDIIIPSMKKNMPETRRIK